MEPWSFQTQKAGSNFSSDVCSVKEEEERFARVLIYFNYSLF
jgi:hypothetical protein